MVEASSCPDALKILFVKASFDKAVFHSAKEQGMSFAERSNKGSVRED